MPNTAFSYHYLKKEKNTKKNKHMKIIFLITITLLLISFKPVVGQESINEADNIFYSQNLNGALESYQKIYKNNKANDEDRALAGRKLAYISWHFNSDLVKTREILRNSLELKIYEAYLFGDLIQYETEAKNFTEAKEVYRQALLMIKSEAKIYLINIAYSNSVLSETIDKIKNKQAIDTLLLNDALNKIEIANKLEPGLKPAKIQLGLALLSKDGRRAMNAWNLYYNISAEQKASGLLAKPQNELSQILLNWNKTSLCKENREKLILNLAASRFYEFAYIMNMYLPDKSKTENNAIDDITNYYKFCEQIENRMYQYYKDIALTNENNIKKVKKDIKTIQKQQWNGLHWEDNSPKYTTTRFYEELYKRFGTKVYEGKFYGYYFYIGGHTIIDENRTVEQFNHKAEIQFVVLDLRFSDNYWGWFTGYYGFAGYANDVIIARYREPASSNPLIYWNKLNNKDLLSKWKDEIIELSAQDDSLSLDNPNTSFNGIYERIRLNVYSQILDSLKAIGFHNGELRKQFISIFNNIEYDHNINHEGRHAIDFNTLSKLKLMNDADLEFRATLSQIYFSKYPLLDIRFEVNNTPHGLANKKLLGLILNWMEQNKEKINGFDKSKPILPQLDLLTNKQLRNIIESLEPFLN